MSHIEVLKEQARRHEQKEEWRKALELYQKAIARLAEEDAPDIGLHNRVGDLFIRVGEVDQAVVALEQAIELYVESELPNNAIAVCKKVLRNVPDRHETFLRMGQIRAQQGFLVDARTHFLTYAERMQVAGQLDEALRALVEFADAAPDDTEIRLAIAAHFQQHERTDEAVEQLVEGYRSALRQNLDDVVETFRTRLEELRPGVDPQDLLEDEAGSDETAFVVEATALGDADPGAVDAVDDAGREAGETDELFAADAPGLEALASPELELEAVTFDVFGSDDDDDAVFTMLPDLDVSVAADPDDDLDDDIGDDLADAIIDDVGDDLADALEESRGSELPLDSERGLDDAISAIGPDVSHLGRAEDPHNPLEGFEVTDEDVLEFDVLDDFEDDDEDDAIPLPLQTFHEPEDGVELPFLESAPDEVDLPDEAETVSEAESILAPPFSPTLGLDDEPAPDAPDGRADDAPDVSAEDAPVDEIDADEAVEAVEVVEAVVDPDDLDALQRLVETAHRSGDDQAVADAYVALGSALRRSGEETRALAVFREALQAVPDHAGARAGVDAAPTPEREVAEVASNEDYVDLGALILGEADEKTTRFVVAYEEPSGDEQADFAKMLSQFKAKVAENVDASDVKAHHDLGTAYKEMGLLDEAVEEFQAALRASSDHLPTYEMLGQTFLDKGTPQTAVRVLTRALDSPYEVEDELLGIYYYLGRSHEESGNKEQAREFYERVFSLDINFADVTERLRALR